MAQGFADAWSIAPHSREDPGYTCCQDPDLRNGASKLDQRVDFVLVRFPDGSDGRPGWARGHYRADVVGDAVGDRTANGIWPADHAGIVPGVWAPPSPFAQ